MEKKTFNRGLSLTKRKKIGKIIWGFAFIIIGISLFGDKDRTREPKEETKEVTKVQTVAKKEVKLSREDEVKKIVSDFIINNPAIFDFDNSKQEIEYMQQEKDWSEGERYKVWLKGNKEGNEWVIYLKSNEIVGVNYITKNEVMYLYKK